MKIAVTMTHDKLYIELWKKYYGHFFDELLVYPTTVHADFVYLRGKSEELIADLLKTYDVVLFTCDDEFVIPLKGWDFEGDFVRCTGYEIVQKDDPPLDFNKPILKQRTYWAKNPFWNKPTLMRVPLVFTQGWHSLKEEVMGEQEGDPNFLLIHLKRVDKDTFLKRNSDINVFHEFDDKVEIIPKKVKDLL